MKVWGLDGLSRIWRRAPTREGRNEQKKYFASVLNAVAITLFVTGLAGPYINPALATSLGWLDRVLLVMAGFVLHLGTRAVLWTLEDR